MSMDRATARKLWNIMVARAGLAGKDQTKWTTDDERRFDREFDAMPGEFRAHSLWRWDITLQDNIDIAKRRGIDVETQYRMGAAGSDYIVAANGMPESPLTRDYPVPKVPGNLYAVGIADKYITPA